jgi:hypothetical protein
VIALNDELALKITSRVDVDPVTACWNWKNSIGKGIPMVPFGKKERAASRVSYAAFVGVLPAGSWLVKSCKNKLCVNPEHLIARTPSPITCPKGHPKTKRGNCSACNKAAWEERKAKLLSTVTELHGEKVTAYFTRARSNRLRSEYGITEDDVVRLLDAQGWGCAICRDPLSVHGKQTEWPNIDHCHETGMVRGVLCMRCNTTLGYMRDRPSLLRRAADYLENSTVPLCSPGPCVRGSTAEVRHA